jgi:hypothetical protein
MPEISIDLSPVMRAVDVVNNNLRIVAKEVSSVQHNVGVVDSKVERLAQDFYSFVLKDSMDKELQRSMTDIIRIRQEIEKKFGYYDEARRRITGILQAVDISVVRKETITSCTEELMLSAPHYWLAPCLIALAAWINNNQDLADKAIKEALRRDDEKPSLLFALISRRANRFNASEIWLERYFSMQDPTALERNMIVVIDAFASGLFGGDSHGNCSRHIKKWITELSEKVGFAEEQYKQWSDALLSRMPGGGGVLYPYLTKYSSTWEQINKSLLAAKLHQAILDYFQNVFSGTISPSQNLATAVDNLLDKLVTNFDDEELSLRQEERLTTLIIEKNGDRDEAQQKFALEKVSLTECFSFTQLLTNAAMYSETSHASKATQWFAIAMSKDWIIKAYEDITAKNRSKVPLDIKLKIEGWENSTRDGSNEEELLKSIKTYLNNKLTKAIEKIKLNIMHWFTLVGGIALIIFGIINPPINILMLVIGLAGLAWFGKSYSDLDKKRKQTIDEFNKLQEQCQNILKATLAETVDVRREIATEDLKYDKVIQFLEEIAPQQFVFSNYSSRMIAGK